MATLFTSHSGGLFLQGGFDLLGIDVLVNGDQRETHEHNNMEGVEVQYTGNRRETLEQYYDIAGKSDGRFSFLSPVRWPEWLHRATEWMCEAHVVAEVGCGYGEFVEHCLQKCGEYLQAYYLIDISQVMLDTAHQRTAQRTAHNRIHRLKKDITINAISEVAPGSLERVIAINVLQDVDSKAALSNIHRLLQPGGYLRATFIRRDTHDLFWEGDENYDVSKGCLYNFSSLHEAAGIPPLGYVLRNGDQKPFYRVQTYFSESRVRELLTETGFVLVSKDEINYPRDMVMQRWSSELFKTVLNEHQKMLLEYWGNTFKDAWDVVAMRV
jgi:SAM-dependent methyltransferase